MLVPVSLATVYVYAIISEISAIYSPQQETVDVEIMSVLNNYGVAAFDSVIQASPRYAMETISIFEKREMIHIQSDYCG